MEGNMTSDLCRLQTQYDRVNISTFPSQYAIHCGGRLITHEDGSLEVASKSLAWVLGEKMAPLVRKCIDAVGSLYRSIERGGHALFSPFPVAEAKSVSAQQGFSQERSPGWSSP